eukprot:snap_masked-scaffold_14-processed-gene-1.9-mRNA-1 protein AED:0.02 eAED:0.02 QI:0/-1/0/1/-1/1/1/0/169
MEKNLSIAPHDLGPKLEERIRNRLKAEVEGKAFENYGYIIKINEVDVEERNKRGLIEAETGMVFYQIKFYAVVFRPFRHEVVDAVVGVCHELGFFCHAGPLEIFVSHRTMQEDMQNFSHEEQKWVTDDRTVEIMAGVAVRVRIMNLRIESNKIFAVGTLKDDYLGVIHE